MFNILPAEATRRTLSTTQRYIEADVETQSRVVDLV